MPETIRLEGTDGVAVLTLHTGRVVTGREAEAMGLVNRAVPRTFGRADLQEGLGVARERRAPRFEGR